MEVGEPSKGATCRDEAKGRAPASVQELKDPMAAMKNLGYVVGKPVKLKKAYEGGQPFLIIEVTKTSVILRECTFDRTPETVEVLPDELVKKYAL